VQHCPTPPLETRVIDFSLKQCLSTTLNAMTLNTDKWPYPLWVAHRGAGKLAPENTLAAFRLGARYGYRMFECDVKLSSDGVPFLLHDSSLGRTTNATQQLDTTASEIAGEHPWHTLAQLDAGSWHSRQYAGEPLPSFANIAHFCLANSYFLNIEIKPTPGLERMTGEVVAHNAAKLWNNAATPPLLSSFDPPALEGARAAQAHLPRALLLDTLWDGWLQTALALQCVAIVCKHTLWDNVNVSQAKSAGFHCLCYTVNDNQAARSLITSGIEGLITDRVDLFSPA
jgi:glycerophosphoryl diester phosphodiesterase